MSICSWKEVRIVPFEDLLDGKCDIYHLTKTVVNMGYGITTEKYGYANVPDQKSVKCHFNVDSNENMEQTDVANEYLYTGKLQLPLGVDIRVNDKIVDCSNGLEFYAEIPRIIRNHHIVVTVQRKGKIAAAL